MTRDLGELVGRGRTSDVYAFGADSVVKVPHREVPDDWSSFEAAITQAVRTQGVPAPEVRDLIEVEGRSAVVFERVHGPSMWRQMLHSRERVDAMTRDFVSIQRSLLTVGIPSGVPDLVDRLVRKVGYAAGLSQPERDEAAALVQSLPRGAALLHGDFHPGNILMGKRGPVVIDWFDATVGHPVADIVRSTILIHPLSAEPAHLPGATADLLSRVQRVYVNEFTQELDAAQQELATWQAAVAAGRLSERAEVDESGLRAMWSRRGNGPSALSWMLGEQ